MENDLIQSLFCRKTISESELLTRQRAISESVQV